jgi:replicative superfamily II helicase
MASSLKDQATNVMVLTQERLHILLIGLPAGRHPTLLIVDEAHKLGDGARGVLLHNVIDTLANQAPSMRIFFASPMVSNPEILLRGRKSSGNQQALTSSHVTVNQNLLWVSQVPRKSKRWNVEVCIGEAMVEIGHIELPFRPTSVSKRLTLIAKVLADPIGGNLIYADGAAVAEKTAHQLWDLCDGQSDIKGDAELTGLIDLIKRYVHPQYALATTLERGVAFHYGNMPLLIRVEIERLFKENRIRFLVCTSTLIEGVNLPCKSIVIDYRVTRR